MTKQDIDKMVKDLWPAECPEYGDNDPVTRYLDGYCRGLKDLAKLVKRRIK